MEEAFGYYANYSAAPGSPATMDPSIMITSGQATSDSVAVDRLKGQYADLVTRLNKGSLDQNAVKSALSGLGVASANTGKILGDIRSVKDAKGAVSTGSKFVSLVGDA